MIDVHKVMTTFILVIRFDRLLPLRTCGVSSAISQIGIECGRECHNVMLLEVLSRFLSCGIWALQEAVYDCLLNRPMQRKTPMQFLFSSESKANLRAVILMAAGINELNSNTHLYLLQLFKYAHLVILSSREVSCHGVKYCILILVIVFFSVMICIRQFSVTEQVDYLLRQATSIDNLSNMYEGWTPWI